MTNNKAIADLLRVVANILEMPGAERSVMAHDNRLYVHSHPEDRGPSIVGLSVPGTSKKSTPPEPKK